MTSLDTQASAVKVTEPVDPKYGRPLTGSDWVGLPLNTGHYPAEGTTGDLTGYADCILIWSGGVSNVTIVGRGPNDAAVSTHKFTRNSGMMDLLPQGTWLESVSWQGEPTTCTSVSFPQACLAELTESLPRVLEAREHPEYCLVDAHVVDLSRRLEKQATGQESLGAVYVQSLSLALASYIAGRYGTGAVRTEASSPFGSGQRQRLIDFIESELSHNFGLVDLATLVGYSPEHFSRLFKNSFGSTPHQYVLSRRVERAKAMLHERGQPIAAIAAACGFASQAHLTEVFKRKTGTTPGAYRKD